MFSDFLIVYRVFLFVVFHIFKKICVLTQGYFILYLRSSCPHFAGAIALFVLSLLYCACVLEVSGIITLGKSVYIF